LLRLCGAPHKRKNWLFVGGDGGLPTASVLMSLCASAKRHGLNPWAYLTDTLKQLAGKPTDVNLLLPDIWAQRHGIIAQPARN
jgi:transposase